MYRKILFAALAFCIANSVYGQNSIGLKAGTGLSYIRNTLKDITPGHRVQPALSAYIGGFKEWRLKGKVPVGAELVLNYYQGVERFPHRIVDAQGQVSQETTAKLSREFLYLSVPLWVGMDFGRFHFNVGVQGALYMGGTYFFETARNPGGIQPVFYTTDVIKYGLGLDVGPRAAFFWDINSRLTLEANYYHGLINSLYGTQIGRNNILNGGIGLRIKF